MAHSVRPEGPKVEAKGQSGHGVGCWERAASHMTPAITGQ